VSRLADARVLVVEDNADLADNLTEILEDEGATVRLASTAAAARASIGDGFDVALLDVQLPDSTGLQLLPDLKRAGDGLAEILLISGYATIQDATQAVTGGAYAYILKPFSGEDLVAHVERAWRQVRSSRTERALAHEIKLREANLRALVETVQALLLVLDGEARIIQANRAVASVTGVDAGDLIGRQWIEEFVPEAERPAVHAMFARLLAGEAHVSHEHRVIARDGTQGTHAISERVVSWRSTPVMGKHGMVRIYASGLDVTEIKELEHRTHLAQRLAAVGTLSAGLAHEIRNPLNSAQLQLRLLDRRIARLGNEDLRGPIRLVQEEIERLSHLVQEFLEFARPAVLNVEDTDLTLVARRVVELEGPGASAHNIDITLDAPEPVIVAVDPAKIQQVLLNLVRNAVEAVEPMNGGGAVVVRVLRDGAGGRLVVRDSGPGLSEEILTRLFEPFFSTKPQGTGLGMAICHSLVTQHGGEINVRSQDGAELEVVLPRQPPSVQGGMAGRRRRPLA
jgi:PAS domain S-box-containing protein